MKLTNDEAIQILNAGLATGADFAEIYLQDSKSENIARRYQKPYGVSKSHTIGAGIRLRKGKQTVYGYSSDISVPALISLAKSLSYGFDGSQEKVLSQLVEKKFSDLCPRKIPFSAKSLEEKLAYLEEGEKAAYSVSPLIQDVTVSLTNVDAYIEIYNSDGFFCKKHQPICRLAVVAVATDGKEFETGYDAPSKREGLELLKETDFPRICKEQAELAVELLSAPYGPSGERPVVLGNGFGGVLFHESCGHPLEGVAISHQESPFAGKLGEKIASDVVNAFDDGTILNAWGSESFDDEGHAPTKNQLIKDGVLVSYRLDKDNGQRLGRKPTGACRRQNYKYAPTTRRTNTYIGNGKSKKEDIIASVKDGIYCKAFSGGQVNPTTDQFLFTSDIAYVIKDGKLDHRIKPVTLTGYGYEILKNITRVGDDLSLAPGRCGAASGSIPVSVGQPTLLISHRLVGGKKED